MPNTAFTKAPMIASFASITLLISAPTLAQSSSELSAKRELESLLASSLVLTDSDAVAFGALSFDPNNYLEVLGGGVGTERSLSRRRNIRTLNLPWHTNLQEKSAEDIKHVFKARLSFLEMEQDLFWGESSSDKDQRKSRVFNVYAGYLVNFESAENWSVETELGAYWQRYDNNYGFENTAAQALDFDVDGLFFDVSAEAATVRAGIAGAYEWQWLSNRWQWQTSVNYYSGETVNTSDRIPKVKPEGWTVSNGLEVKRPLQKFWGQKNQLDVSLRRIDLGADLPATFATQHYYRLAVGWLISLPDDTPWLDNVGVEVAINRGSALSGGELLLLYNEKF